MTIFSPIRVGTMPLGHRLVVPPHSEGGGALLGTEERSGLTGGQLAVAALARMSHQHADRIQWQERRLRQRGVKRSGVRA